MKLALKIALYRYSTREHLTYPTKVPSLSDKQVVKTNSEVKRAQDEDTSALGAASTTNIRQKKEHRLESSPLNMDLQRQSDISQSFCPGKFSFLYTAQPPYFHFDTVIEHSNWPERSGYVYVVGQLR